MEHYSRKINFGGNWTVNSSDDVTETTGKNLHTLCDFLIENKNNIKTQFIRRKLFIYSNNKDMGITLDNLGIFDDISVTEVILDRPRGTVKSRYPGYILRVYFKPISITELERHNLLQFINNNDSSLKMNVGMDRWHRGDRSRMRYLTLRDYYFIDFTDQRLASMLELVCPGVIRKTMDIIYDDK